jgi:uridine phosphorylase
MKMKSVLLSSFLIALSVFGVLYYGLNLKQDNSKKPIVTAKKLIDYKRENGHLKDFIPPKVVLVCYQSSTLKHLLGRGIDIRPSAVISDLYLVGDGKVGVLADMGIGAPALAISLEELIALGVTKFVAVGTAGTLQDHKIGDYIKSERALAEDGVAHHYLANNQRFSHVDKEMLNSWEAFAKKQSLPAFEFADAWSFSAIFKESAEDVARVRKEGCGIVEMEAATLYAIGQEKGVQTLSLFVVSDSLSVSNWTPHLKEPRVRDNLHKLADWALHFCQSDLAS